MKRYEVFWNLDSATGADLNNLGIDVCNSACAAVNLANSKGAKVRYVPTVESTFVEVDEGDERIMADALVARGLIAKVIR